MRQAFVLLELMNHMVLIAQEAKARGYTVVALNHDPLRRSGPFTVADGLIDEVIEVQSWSDTLRVNGLIAQLHERYQVAGTYAAFEPTLPFEATLRELAGLPNNGTHNVLRVLDKAQVRRRLYTEGLSQLRSATLSDALKWTVWPFPGSAVLKPGNGTGSALCFVVSSLEELHDAAHRAGQLVVGNPLMREYIRSHGEFVLEQRAHGELMSVESLVFRGRVHTVGLMARYVLADDPVVEMGMVFPYHHPRHDDIVHAVRRFHESLGVVHGATHVEVMVPSEGPVELIDFNIRMAGVGGAVALSEAFGVSYPAVLTDLACDTEPDLSFMDRPVRYAADQLVLPPPGETELRELVFPPGSLCRRMTKEIGQPLSGRADQLDVVAMYVITADTAAEIHAEVVESRRNVVFNGKPLADNPNNRLAFPAFAGRDSSAGK